MVRLAIPKNYTIAQKSHNSTIVRSQDHKVSLFFSELAHGQSPVEQAEFIDRMTTEMQQTISELKPLAIEPRSTTIKGIPTLQAMAAGKINDRPVHVGMIMQELTDCILFTLIIADSSSFKAKQAELQSILGSISNTKIS
jgi:hypothetical protein